MHQDEILLWPKANLDFFVLAEFVADLLVAFLVKIVTAIRILFFWASSLIVAATRVVALRGKRIAERARVIFRVADMRDVLQDGFVLFDRCSLSHPLDLDDICLCRRVNLLWLECFSQNLFRLNLAARFRCALEKASYHTFEHRGDSLGAHCWGFDLKL